MCVCVWVGGEASKKCHVAHLELRRQYHASELWREGHWNFADSCYLYYLSIDHFTFLVVLGDYRITTSYLRKLE